MGGGTFQKLAKSSHFSNYFLPACSLLSLLKTDTQKHRNTEIHKIHDTKAHTYTHKQSRHRHTSTHIHKHTLSYKKYMQFQFSNATDPE